MTARREGWARRRRAGRTLSKRAAASASAKRGDLASLLQELQVHQVELEMQNSALREAETSLQAMRDYYATLYHRTPVAFITLDAARVIREANPAACTLLGVGRERLLGLSLAGFVVRRDQPALLGHLARACGEGAATYLELELLRRDGQRRTVRLDTAAQRPGEDAAAMCHCTIIDVTDQTRLTRELQAQRVLLERRGVELQELSRRLLAAREEEGRRIAADLHDDIGQRLEAASVELDLLLGHLKDVGHPLASDVGAILRQLTDVATDIDRLSRQIHPKMVDDLGLSVALRVHAEDLERRWGLAVRLRMRGVLPPLAPAVAVTLYRVAQEALRNVVRHARAKRATLTVAHTGAGVGLCVADDGRGFVPAARRSGLGLVSMEERMRALGGGVSVRSVPQHGTHVHAWLATERMTS